MQQEGLAISCSGCNAGFPSALLPPATVSVRNSDRCQTRVSLMAARLQLPKWNACIFQENVLVPEMCSDCVDKISLIEFYI